MSASRKVAGAPRTSRSSGPAGRPRPGRFPRAVDSVCVVPWKRGRKRVRRSCRGISNFFSASPQPPQTAGRHLSGSRRLAPDWGRARQLLELDPALPPPPKSTLAATNPTVMRPTLTAADCVLRVGSRGGHASSVAVGSSAILGCSWVMASNGFTPSRSPNRCRRYVAAAS